MGTLVSDDIVVSGSITDEYIDTLKSREYTECAVITCAASNIRVARHYQDMTEQENNNYLLSRTEFILKIAMINRVNTLIPGAWGCGVFGQSAVNVVMIFRHLLDTIYLGKFKKVIFDIPDKCSKNYIEFSNVFG